MTPTEIRKIGDRKMKLSWPDGRVCDYEAVTLRANCRCAACRNEHTGELILDPASLPTDIRILKSEILGNYALGFLFSDGHSTGIYTFDYLRSLCPPRDSQ